jgi:hypothetical protein
MPPSPRFRFLAARLLLWAALCTTSTFALAQQAGPATAIEQWGFDPAVLVADGTELLARAPDRSIDALFQAVHASSRDAADAQVLCRLFDPAADRSLAGLNATAARLSDASRERFAGAVAEVFVGAMQHPPRPRDPEPGRRALRAAGVRAAMLNDDFSAGLRGDDHAGRCRSVTMLLDSLHGRPLAERAAVTRLLLAEGMTRLASGDFATAGETPLPL